MRSRAPSPEAQVRHAFAAVQGQRLTGVLYRYVEPPTDDAPAGYRSDHPSVDSDLQVVALQFETRPVVLSWAIRDDDVEGLHVGQSGDGGLRESLPTADVSSRPQWANLVGSQLDGVAGSWYDADDERILWSIRLSFAGGPAVIALGGLTATGGDLTYESDELIAIFDEPTARAYHRWPQDPASWGAPLGQR